MWRLHRTATSGAEAFEDDDYFDDLHDIPGHYINAGGEFLIALMDGNVVAMGGLLARAAGVAEVLRMRVDPRQQRSGVGTAVLTALEGKARDAGCGTVVLQTTLVQIAARRFYESQGYRETRRDLEDGYEVVRYKKDLG